MTDNPYNKIGSVVEQWCKEHVYAQMLVTISLGYGWELPHKETHLLDFDAETGELVWDSDWWEGQRYVELVGFTPLYKVRLKGEGEYARTVRHGRWGHRWICSNMSGYEYACSCSECGKPTYRTSTLEAMPPYCPHCGADMREDTHA